MKTEKIVVKVNEDLHPKTRRHPFIDKNGTRHESVAAAFIKVTEGFTSKLTVGQVIEVLAKIIFTQIMAHKEKLGGLIRSTMGMNFELGQDKVDFLPGEPSQGWGFLYGVALFNARKMFLNMAKAATLEESTGAVPPGAQPCLKCGGEGKVAGSGHFLAVCNPMYPGGWKHVGACFDCLPKDSTESRGRGWIDRRTARKNHTYFTYNEARWTEGHVGLDNLNLWDPDDSKLWKIIPECAECGVGRGEGKTIIVGRNSKPTMCQDCIEKNPEAVGVNMKEIVLDVTDSEVPT